jgi:succinyl-CoA synthetase beta subunit
MCIKAQIHAGRRREGYFNSNLEYGGGTIARSKRETINVVRRMLGDTFAIKQTVTKGKK